MPTKHTAHACARLSMLRAFQNDKTSRPSHARSFLRRAQAIAATAGLCCMLLTQGCMPEPCAHTPQSSTHGLVNPPVGCALSTSRSSPCAPASCAWQLWLWPPESCCSSAACITKSAHAAASHTPAGASQQAPQGTHTSVHLLRMMDSSFAGPRVPAQHAACNLAVRQARTGQ